MITVNALFNIASRLPAIAGRWLLFKILLCAIAICFLGYWLLYAAASGDGAAIIENLRQTPDYFPEDYPKVGFQHVDMYTECVALGIAANLQQNFASVIKMNNVGPCQGLRSFLDNPAQAATGVYGRYWQGYQSIMRPLLLLFSYGQMRMLVCVSSLLALIYFFYLLAGNAGRIPALMVFLAFGLTMRAGVFFLAAYGVQFWLVIGAAIAVLKIPRKYHKDLPLLFAAIGGLDSYFTFLNLPSMSLSIPLLCHALRQASAKAVVMEEEWGRAFLCCTAWVLGAVLVWSGKWALLRYVQGDWNFFGATLNYYSLGSRWPFEATSRCLLALQFKSIIFIVIASALLWLKKRGRKKIQTGAWLLLLPGLVPIIWYELAMPGHAAHHPGITSFALWPLFAAILLIFSSPLQHNSN
jgi:hypothetical protein